MIVEARSTELVYPRAVKMEKMRLVLDWLLEFRFSTLDLLAKRIGSNKTNSNRFFNSLIDDEFITVFKNAHTANQRYVMLTHRGVSYLETLGRNVENATTRYIQLGKYSTIVHDLCVQYAILNRLDRLTEVVWDRNINQIAAHDRPDALLKHEKGYWIALEYERWRKEKKRVFYSLMNHARGIAEQRYAGVYYIFSEQRDYNYYSEIFNEAEWPKYKRAPKTGKLTPLDGTFSPDSVANLRRCFAFFHEPETAVF